MVEFEDTRKPGRDMGLLVLFLIIVGVLWYAQGGPGKMPPSPFLDGNDGSVIVPAGVGDNGGGNGGNEDSPTLSPDAARVSVKTGKAKETDPRKEYVEIELLRRSETAVDITGWKVESEITRVGFNIPSTTEGNVVLQPGDKAVVSTGRSPVSAGFRVNVCSGYFSRHKEFYPPLFKRCPYPKDEEWPASLSFECLDYIDTLPRCTANIVHPYSLQDNDCIAAINSRLSYNGCVEAHKDDDNFFENEWRVYLGRDAELWRAKHETIVLKDKEGRVVDSVSY